MGDFKKQGGFRGGFGGDRGGFKGGFGGKPRFGGRPGGNRDFGPREMFSAVCAECGKTCEVPFRPNGEKPVYCNVCFGKNKPVDGGQGGHYNTPRNDFHSAPVQSSGSKSQVSGGQSFGGTVKIDGAQMAEIRDQLQSLNAKIEKLMVSINPKTEKSVAPEKKSTKKLASKKK